MHRNSSAICWFIVTEGLPAEKRRKEEENTTIRTRSYYSKRNSLKDWYGLDILIFIWLLLAFENPYIFPSFPSFLPSFRMCVSLPTAAANGPRGLNFGMQMGLEYCLTLFGQSGSKVKVKNPWKYAFSRPILVTGAMCGTIQDQGGSGGVLLAACQLMLATCQKL